MDVEWEQFEELDRGVTLPAGFRAAADRCGLKTQGDDLALIACDQLSPAAAVFTTNRVRAHSIPLSEAVALRGQARGAVVNAGNANCCNGEQGLQDARSMVASIASQLDCRPEEIFIAQTGIIGHVMPMDRVNPTLSSLSTRLSAGPEADITFANAIMTTDLVPKQAGLVCKSADWSGAVHVGGACKGSGMIAPQMGPPHATMLCFITTDAEIDSVALQTALNQASSRTFNRMTVDADTSTNDMITLIASGRSGVTVPSSGLGYDAFVAALENICLRLAKSVARDGEGATKLVAVNVTGASSEEDAELAARTIADSPLVKTALFGNDPNWGRILMATGRSGANLDPTKLAVRLGDIRVCQNGGTIPFDRDAAHDYLTQKDVEIFVDLGVGTGAATVWTCDFSYDYVKINAEYHT